MNFEKRIKKMYAKFHKHKCDVCGTVWEHPAICGGHNGSHICPQCGKGKSLKYEGPIKPDFRFTERHGE